MTSSKQINMHDTTCCYRSLSFTAAAKIEWWNWLQLEILSVLNRVHLTWSEGNKLHLAALWENTESVFKDNGIQLTELFSITDQVNLYALENYIRISVLPLFLINIFDHHVQYPIFYITLKLLSQEQSEHTIERILHCINT